MKKFLLILFLLVIHSVAFADVKEKLIVEYSQDALPEQQAAIQEMIKNGSAKPIDGNSSIKGFTFLIKEQIYYTLHQGRMYNREYPLEIIGEKQFEATNMNEIGNGIGAFPTGFQMGLDYSKSDNNEMCDIFFHAEKYKLESLLGNSTARVRTYHSAGKVSLYPNHCVALINIDGDGGFLILTYIRNINYFE